jgi:diadenosine tetraphosphate (Ap4A) HIT family hydrolase
MYDANNVFAKIIRGEIPSNKIYEDAEVLAFHNIAKAAPTHVLVIPKGEFANYYEFVNKADANKVANFFKIVAKIAKDLDLQESGYRLISNVGPDASQSVPHFPVDVMAIGCDALFCTAHKMMAYT